MTFTGMEIKLMPGTYKKTLFTSLALGLLLASAALAGTAEQNTAARFSKAGAEQLKSGDYGAARDSFSEALRYDDTDPNAHLGLGVAYFICATTPTRSGN